MSPETRSPVPRVMAVGLLAGLTDWAVWVSWGSGDDGPFQAFRVCAFVVCAVAAVVVLGVRFRGAPTNVAPLAVAVGIVGPAALAVAVGSNIDAFKFTVVGLGVLFLVSLALAIVADLTRIVLAWIDRWRR